MADCILEVPLPIIQDLVSSIEYGMIAEIRPDGNHVYHFQKALVEKQGGLKVEIYAKEHPPPHFHVTFRGDKAIFALDDGRLLVCGGRARLIEKNVRLYYKENRSKLIRFWNDFRPSDCPVGPVRE